MSEGESYADGIRGEQRAAGSLSAAQHSRYRVIHSMPLSKTKELDHLAIGPGCVYSIHTKVFSYPFVL